MMQLRLVVLGMLGVALETALATGTVDDIEASQKVFTDGGYVPQLSKCALPFTFLGKEYFGCVPVLSAPGGNDIPARLSEEPRAPSEGGDVDLWCPTNEQFGPSDTNWGYCLCKGTFYKRTLASNLFQRDCRIQRLSEDKSGFRLANCKRLCNEDARCQALEFYEFSQKNECLLFNCTRTIVADNPKNTISFIKEYKAPCEELEVALAVDGFPTPFPTSRPSVSPTGAPTPALAPTGSPITVPTLQPTEKPTQMPVGNETLSPPTTRAPSTQGPTTEEPTPNPTPNEGSEGNEENQDINPAIIAVPVILGLIALGLVVFVVLIRGGNSEEKEDLNDHVDPQENLVSGDDEQFENIDLNEGATLGAAKETTPFQNLVKT